MNVHWTKTLQAIILAALLVTQIDSCGDLPAIANAVPVEKVLPPFVVGSGVRYDCTSGYKIISGSHIAVCQQENGTTFWKPPTIRCELEGCNTMPPKLHQSAPKEEDEFGSPPFPIGTTVTYKCGTGYVAQAGSTDSVCILKDGRAQWELPSLTCRGVSCGDPKMVRHADRMGHVFDFPHNVTYVCHEGYETEDTNVLFCLPSSVWSNDRPVCKAIQCHELKSPENGAVDVKEFTYRSTAKYRCDDGYRLEGSVERECNADRSWSGVAPNCSKVTCPPIAEVPNGKAIHLPNSKSVIISCYHPDNRKVTVTCSHSGQWQPPIPKCKGDITTPVPKPLPTTKAPILDATEAPKESLPTMQCGNPGNISNGRIDHYNETFPVNFNLSYSCLPGYQMKGRAVLTCNSMGKWSPGVVPACEKPLTVEVIIGIVLGVVALVALLVAAGLLCMRWRKQRMIHHRKACIIDAKDLEEIRTLERDKKYIPVTSL